MKHDGTTLDDWHPGEIERLPAMIARVRKAAGMSDETRDAGQAEVERGRWMAVYDAMVYAIAGPEQRRFDLSHQMASDDNDRWIAAMQAAVQEAGRQGLTAMPAPEAVPLETMLDGLCESLPGTFEGYTIERAWRGQQVTATVRWTTPMPGDAGRFGAYIHHKTATAPTAEDAIRAAVRAAQGDEA